MLLLNSFKAWLPASVSSASYTVILRALCLPLLGFFPCLGYCLLFFGLCLYSGLFNSFLACVRVGTHFLYHLVYFYRPTSVPACSFPLFQLSELGDSAPSSSGQDQGPLPSPLCTCASWQACPAWPFMAETCLCSVMYRTA